MSEFEQEREYRDADDHDVRQKYGAHDDERNETREEVAFHVPRD